MQPPSSASAIPRPQEPWDFARMVALYNQIAEARGGWHFEHDRTEGELRRRYTASPDTYPDLRTFADGLFIWDQRVNL